MVRFERLTSYEEGWERIYGEGGVAAWAEAWFAEMFPSGHDVSIREMVRLLRDKVAGRMPPSQSELDDSMYFHPNAYDLLLKYGVDYKPDISRVNFFHASKDQPGLRQCFTNSRILMEVYNSRPPAERNLVYVEGMVWGFATDPCLHAWNSYGLADGQALDWTHYPYCKWNRYFGIPFTQDECLEIQAIVYADEPRTPVQFFDRDSFPLVEERITSLLASRTA